MPGCFNEEVLVVPEPVLNRCVGQVHISLLVKTSEVAT